MYPSISCQHPPLPAPNARVQSLDSGLLSLPLHSSHFATFTPYFRALLPVPIPLSKGMLTLGDISISLLAISLKTFTHDIVHLVIHSSLISDPNGPHVVNTTTYRSLPIFRLIYPKPHAAILVPAHCTFHVGTFVPAIGINRLGCPFPAPLPRTPSSQPPSPNHRPGQRSPQAAAVDIQDGKKSSYPRVCSSSVMHISVLTGSWLLNIGPQGAQSQWTFQKSQFLFKSHNSYFYDFSMFQNVS